MDLVMQELEAEGGLRSVALLREVCKAWRAAFSAYPGKSNKQVRRFGTADEDRAQHGQP